MKTKHWIMIIAVIVIAFSFDKFMTSNNIDNLVASIENYSGEVDSFRLSNNALVKSNESLKLSTQSQIKSLTSKNDTLAKMIKNFKQVQNVTMITNNFLASGDSSKFNNAIPCDFAPFKDTISNKNYIIEQTISRTGTVIDKLFIPNEQKLVFGTKKVGLFKTQHFVDVNNSNELMVVSNIKNYTFVPKKQWYEKPIITGAIGFGLGFTANSILLQTLKR